MVWLSFFWIYMTPCHKEEHSAGSVLGSSSVWSWTGTMVKKWLKVIILMYFTDQLQSGFNVGKACPAHWHLIPQITIKPSSNPAGFHIWNVLTLLADVKDSCQECVSNLPDSTFLLQSVNFFHELWSTSYFGISEKRTPQHYDHKMKMCKSVQICKGFSMSVVINRFISHLHQ